jgi:hypothetical protein
MNEFRRWRETVPEIFCFVCANARYALDGMAINVLSMGGLASVCSKAARINAMRARLRREERAPICDIDGELTKDSHKQGILS